MVVPGGEEKFVFTTFGRLFEESTTIQGNAV